MSFFSFFHKFKKSWSFVLLAFAIGVILLLISFVDDSLIYSESVKNALRIAGQTVLSSAVFLGIVKTLQYSDYFKDEINEVMFTDRYLKGLSLDSLREKWILVTNVLHSSTFPSLKSNLNNHLLDGIISIPKNYTHSRMRISFTISEIGKDKKFFSLTEKVDMKIIGQKDAAINFSIDTHIIKEDFEYDQSNIRLSLLTVDGVDMKSQIPAPQNEKIEPCFEKVKIQGQLSLPLKSSYSIIKELESIHSTTLNGLWRSDFETFVEDGLEVNLFYDKKVFEIDLLGIGQTIKLQEDIFDKQLVKYTCQNLIFQKDCLILVIKYK